MASSASGTDGEHADVRLLQIVHKTLRLATTRLIDASANLEPPKLESNIAAFWDFYAAVVHYHHHTEDTIDFPALLAVRPDLAELVGKLGEEHKDLDAALQSAGAAVAWFAESPDPGTQQAMHASFVTVRDEFFPHLDVEDAQILPAFAESIPHAQWEEMDAKALKSIPRRYLSKAVAALDEVIQTVPEAERPVGGPPLPVRVLLAVSWRKKWAAFVAPLKCHKSIEVAGPLTRDSCRSVSSPSG
jgi:hemerythrin-like domain-containing protein